MIHDKQFIEALDLETDVPVIYDVGANVGEWSQAVLEKWPDAYIYAFEPNPEACIEYRKRVKEHGFLYDIALSNYVGTSKLYYNGGPDVLASLSKRDLSYQNQEHGIHVIDVRTDILKNYIIACSLLKIDVEGHEIDVLRGLGQTLNPTYVKNIYWEYNSCALDTRTFFKDFWDLLTPAGYDIYQIVGTRFQHIPEYHPRLEDFASHRDFFAKKKYGIT